MSVQPLSASQDSNNGSENSSNVSYMEGFDDPSANVVLMGSDKMALRVPDYYLKAASPFFRDMLEAGTKGGPVPLEALSGQLKFILEKVTTGKFSRSSLAQLSKSAPTSACDNDYENIWNLIEMHHIAERYLFEDVCFGIRGIIASVAHEHAPMALSFACQRNPPNGPIARAALQAFVGPLGGHMVGHYFKNSYWTYEDLDDQEYASPTAHSITKVFAREIGVDALLAYIKATEEVFGLRTAGTGFGIGTKPSEWEAVAEIFLAEMGIDAGQEDVGLFWSTD